MVLQCNTAYVAEKGGDFQLARADRLGKGLKLEPPAAGDGLLDVGNPQRHGTHRRSVGDVVGMGKAIAFSVDDEVDVSLPPD